MDVYLTQLLSDIQSATLKRWQYCPPHHYLAGIRDAMHQPPEGFDATQVTTDASRLDDFEAYIAEMEAWLYNEPPSTNMFDIFGFSPEQFPSAEQLSEEQVGKLTEALVRLWVAFNFMPTIPQKTPARLIYGSMLLRMAEPAMAMEYGVNGIEFCSFDPEQCPFGEEFCSCKDLDHDM